MATRGMIRKALEKTKQVKKSEKLPVIDLGKRVGKFDEFAKKYGVEQYNEDLVNLLPEGKFSPKPVSKRSKSNSAPKKESKAAQKKVKPKKASKTKSNSKKTSETKKSSKKCESRLEKKRKLLQRVKNKIVSLEKLSLKELRKKCRDGEIDIKEAKDRSAIIQLLIKKYLARKRKSKKSSGKKSSGKKQKRKTLSKSKTSQNKKSKQ